MYNYNSTIHSTIKAIPYDVFNGHDTNKQKITQVDVKLKVGDHVRIKIPKNVFDKGDVNTYSDKVYIVKKINKNSIILFDVPKTFKQYDLRKVNSLIDFQQTSEDIVHNEAKQTKKIDKQLQKEEIDQINVRTNARTKRSTKQNDFVY